MHYCSTKLPNFSVFSKFYQWSCSEFSKITDESVKLEAMHVVGENSSYTVVYSVYTCTCCTKSNRTYEEKKVMKEKTCYFLQLVKVINCSIYDESYLCYSSQKLFSIVTETFAIKEFLARVTEITLIMSHPSHTRLSCSIYNMYIYIRYKNPWNANFLR